MFLYKHSFINSNIPNELDAIKKTIKFIYSGVCLGLRFQKWTLRSIFRLCTLIILCFSQYSHGFPNDDMPNGSYYLECLDFKNFQCNKEKPSAIYDTTSIYSTLSISVKRCCLLWEPPLGSFLTHCYQWNVHMVNLWFLRLFYIRFMDDGFL